MDEAMVAKLEDYGNSDLPEAHKLALRFVESWVQEKAQSVDEKFLADLRRHFTPAQVIELSTLAGIYESVHKFNHLFEMEAPAQVFEFDDFRVPARLASHVDELAAKRKSGR